MRGTRERGGAGISPPKPNIERPHAINITHPLELKVGNVVGVWWVGEML